MSKRTLLQALSSSIRGLFHDEYTRVERRVYRPRKLATEEFTDRNSRERTKVSRTELDNASYASRLEEDQGYQTRSRTTRLPEQQAGMGRKHKEIPDPWLDSYK